MKKQAVLNSVFRKLGKLNEECTIKFTIPLRYILVAGLIILALTGKIGATVAFVISVFLVFILMIPDDY